MNIAQEVVTRVKIKSGKIGLHLDAKKTEIRHYNQVDPVPF